jgi:hemerythrin-like domain-containing protein
MTTTIEILMSEHRTIERVLDALEAYARRTEAGEELEHEELGRFVHFLRGYADALHHGKEEELLFQRLIGAGFPRETGPVAVMLTEHDAGRALVRALGELAQKPTWSPVEARAVANGAFEFSALLRAHIQKEDRILYPMAEQRMAAEVMEALDGEIDQSVRANAAKLLEFEQLATELEDRWIGRPQPSAAGMGHSCEFCGGCGGH